MNRGSETVGGLRAGTLAAVLSLLGFAAVAARPAGIHFTDVTKNAGLTFVHAAGSSGHNYFPESMGSGAAFLDYDGDGRLDIFLAGGGALPGYVRAAPSGNRLYRNLGDATFADVTASAGLTTKQYTIGVASADYDNDGHADLYLTTVQGNILYHNDGRGRFVDATARAGVAVPALSTGAAFLDFDRDGLVDLFVSRYADYTLAGDRGCVFMSMRRPELEAEAAAKSKARGNTPGFCSPLDYPATSSRLFRNLGNGRFADVSRVAGILGNPGRSLGIGVGDFNEDGWPDIFVASDTMPNLLFINRGDGTFKQDAVRSGVSVYVNLAMFAGMGVDAADVDNDGHIDLLVSNFEAEPLVLYRGRGDGTFADGTVKAGLSELGRYFVKWGCRLVDLNGDGLKDIFMVNSHIDSRGSLRPLNMPDAMWKGKTFAQEAQVYVNQSAGGFADATPGAGAFFAEKHVARGAAFGDVDNDGDIDVVVLNVNTPATLLRNDQPAHRWVRIELQGDRCNRDGLGARVQVSSGGLVQTEYVRSGGSYLSEHDHRALFALPGAAPAVAEIEWPCGATQRVMVSPGTTLKVKEEHCLLKRARQP